MSLKEIVRWVRRLVARVFATPVSAPIAGAARQKPQPYQSEALSSFSFKADLLDQLPLYFWALRRMRAKDPEAFALYSKIGMALVPPESEMFERNTELTPWWKQHRPTFGAVGLGVSKKVEAKARKEDEMHPRFLYFQKYEGLKGPTTIQRVPQGDLYVLTIYWDDGKDFRVPIQYPFGIDAGGELKLLRVRLPGNTKSPQLTGWGVDPWIKARARERKKDVQTYAKELFVLAATGFEYAQGSVVRVNVKHGDLVAAFGIDPKRTAYFFRDRDVDLRTLTGQKRRIFHSVRPHMRRGGKAVGLHFRGLRDFDWQGYNIHIAVPGLHHADALNFTGGAIDAEVGTNVPTSTVAEVAAIIQNQQER